MNNFIKIINKYIILLIIPGILNYLWSLLINQVYFNIDNKFISQIRDRIYDDFDSYAFSMPVYFSYIFHFIIIGFLIYDFRKYKLKNVLLTCIATYFFPILGVAIFLILYILKENGARDNILN